MNNADRFYPLCALALSASMINILSLTGQTRETEFIMLRNSIFSLNPISPLSIYENNATNLKRGAKILSEMLSLDKLHKHHEPIRYFVEILKVECLLNEEKRLSEKLGRKLKDILTLVKAFEDQINFNGNLKKLTTITRRLFRCWILKLSWEALPVCL